MIYFLKQFLAETRNSDVQDRVILYYIYRPFTIVFMLINWFQNGHAWTFFVNFEL